MDGASLDRTLSEVLEESFKFYMDNLGVFVLAGCVHLVLSTMTLGLLSGPLTVGMVLMVQRRRQGETVEVGAIFSGFSQVVAAIVAGILLALLIGIGFLLLIIPGILLSLVWALTFQAMALEKLGPLQAMGRSYEIFKDNALLVGVMALLLFVLNAFASTVLFGVVLTFPFSVMATTLLYERLAPGCLEGASPDQAGQPAQVVDNPYRV